MSLILSVDTSNDTCTVVLGRFGQVVASRQVPMRGSEFTSVASFAHAIFEEENIDPRELNAVAVGCGPGSYTGLRIALSFAKGLCYGLSVPLIAIGSLDIWAQSLLLSDLYQRLDTIENVIFAPMIDARRMEVYTALYSGDGKVVAKPWAEVVEEDSFAEYRDSTFIIFGGGAAKCQETLPWAQYADVKISVAALSLLADSRYNRGSMEDMATYEPEYLKEYVVKRSTKKLF